MEQRKKDCALLEIFHYVSDCPICGLTDKAASGWLKTNCSFSSLLLLSSFILSAKI